MTTEHSKPDAPGNPEDSGNPDMSVSPDISPPANIPPSPDQDILCACSGTRRSRIRELYMQGQSLDDISRRTGALSGCGGCEWEITGYLQELEKAAALKDANQPVNKAPD